LPATPRTGPYERLSRIRLLPRMVSGEAHVGIGMEDAYRGKPPVDHPLHALPRIGPTLPPAAQCLPPEPGHTVSECLFLPTVLRAAVK
jgi:hypothetical protein